MRACQICLTVFQFLLGKQFAFIQLAIAVKAAIVARDERESGDRALLNFGHTLGHALEAEGGFTRLTHGEAVSLGMVAMLRAGRALGATPVEEADRVVRLLDKLGLLIEELDVRHHQVLVETLVVALTEDQSRDLGVELRATGSSDETLFQLASLFGLGAPDPRSTILPALQGSGFAGVILDPGDFSAAVRALETINQGRSLTTPKVIVNNNETATLDSVLQTPFASTNASDTVATTSFGGTFDAGTSISIQPQVTEGDQIVLDYSVSLSRFTGDSVDPTLPPPRQENKLESVVTVPDGHTVVIGGLEIESAIEGSSRVPLLGDLPIVGQLFRSDSRTLQKSRFFVFIRCSVLRSKSFEDLKYLSRADLETAGLKRDGPRLDPIIIR